MTSTADDLLDLMSRKSESDQGRLLLAMGEICALKPLGTGEAASLVTDLMVGLLVKTDKKIRLMLSDSLADIPRAPRGLMRALASDDIAIARGVILKNAALMADDLIALVSDATSEHRQAIAQREDLPANVSHALVVSGDTDALVMLLNNISASIDAIDLDRCADLAKTERRLQAPLCMRPDLSTAVIEKVATFVEQTLRAALQARYPDAVDYASLPLAKAKETFVERSRTETSWSAQDTSPIATANGLGISSATRMLVTKLARSNRLTPAFIIRSAAEGKIETVNLGLVLLAGVDEHTFHTAVGCDAGLAYAFCARAAGFDRSVYPSLHTALRNEHVLRAPLEGDEKERIMDAMSMPASVARDALSALAFGD